MKIRIEPYKTWSGGAKALGLKCGILRATRRQVRKHGDFDTIINWGRSARRFEGNYINAPEAVSTAANKLRAAEAFQEAEVPQPDFTTDADEAASWLADGFSVVERHLLRANSGRGIRIVPSPESPDYAETSAEARQLTAAPLYTKYEKKAEEYRVHVFMGEVIDVQQKKKRQEVDNEEVDYQVRNSANGWVFCRDQVEAPACVLEAGVRAVQALALDFGAVDIGYNVHREAPYVYEVNTAPGLEGTTLDRYFEAVRALCPAINHGAFARRRNGTQ